MNAQKEIKAWLVNWCKQNRLETHAPTIFMKPALRYVEADFGTRFTFAYKLSSKARHEFVNGVK